MINESGNRKDKIGIKKKIRKKRNKDNLFKEN